MKNLINAFFGLFGYAIRRPYNFFSLNHNLNWLKELEIKTVLDIGANTGQFASFICNLLGKDTLVYSFEPINECYNKLSKLKKKFINIVPLNYALGDVETKKPMYKNDFTPSSSLMEISGISIENFPFTEHQEIENIDLKRLDDIYKDMNIVNNVLVKIDVQGYEGNVIAGGEEFLKKIPKLVIIETSIKNLYVNEPSFDYIYNKMISLGYKYRGNLDQLFSPINGEILQVDCVFEKI
jgi:FkbM family methyltransferase